ncbi:hypothetical protein FI667_g4844, partial [Globisporangium splendens]
MSIEEKHRPLSQNGHCEIRRQYCQVALPWSHFMESSFSFPLPLSLSLYASNEREPSTLVASANFIFSWLTIAQNRHDPWIFSILDGERPKLDPRNTERYADLDHMIELAWQSEPEQRPSAQQLVMLLECIQEQECARFARDAGRRRRRRRKLHGACAGCAALLAVNRAYTTHCAIRCGCLAIRDRITNHDPHASRSYCQHHLPKDEHAAEAFTDVAKRFQHASSNLHHQWSDDEYAFPALTKIPRGSMKKCLRTRKRNNGRLLQQGWDQVGYCCG